MLRAQRFTVTVYALAFSVGAIAGSLAAAAECTDEVRAYHYERFIGQGLFKRLHCGDGAKHMEYWAGAPCAQLEPGDQRPRSVLVIGGNTGSDCVGFLRLVSGNKSYAFHAWQKDVERELNEPYPRPACRNDEYPLRKSSGAGPTKVLCVEPQPNNAKILAKVAASSYWKASLVTIQAAALDEVPDSGTVPFTVDQVTEQSFGYEMGSIVTAATTTSSSSGGSRSAAAAPPARVEHVPATTVDALVAEHLGGVPPAILAIDTEGFDGLVLRGARTTLGSSDAPGLLEFEYHAAGPWGEMRLEQTISELDAFGYDCYWMQGPLIPLTCFDWARFADAHDWSNVVCARRADRCWATALEKAAAVTGAERETFARKYKEWCAHQNLC